jgi:hypothetical protein
MAHYDHFQSGVLPYWTSLGERQIQCNSFFDIITVARVSATVHETQDGITKASSKPHRLTIQFKLALRRPCRLLPWSFFMRSIFVDGSPQCPYQQLILAALAGLANRLHQLRFWATPMTKQQRMNMDRYSQADQTRRAIVFRVR